MILTNMNNKIISIHAPRTGSDQTALKTGADPVIFQSTLPARGATDGKDYIDADTIISIHAPRTGSDRMVFALPIPKVISIHAPRTGSDDFRRDLFGNQQISIHAPRTGSDGKRAGIHDGQRSFQSTLPARGATHCPAPYDHGAGISIHAPRTGSDTGRLYL